jgi:signal transduction histidine kinase
MERFARGDRDARMIEAGPQELRSMVQRFNALADSLAAQRQAQMAFLAGVAHDLRNPLSALKLSVQTIDPEQPLPPEPRIRRTISTLERQLTRLERMLGDFLDMTKIEAGELELHPEPHDARALVQNVVELFDAVSPHRRIETKLPPEPVLIRCDGLRIEQVVSNLVSNALKYSAEDTPILVALRTRQNQAIIEVSDHGPGITDRELPRLFEPFRRGLAAVGPPGVGLGLFVVRRIVEAHDGRIDVESSPGRGSTFRVYLDRIGQRDRALPAATL